MEDPGPDPPDDPHDGSTPASPSSSGGGGGGQASWLLRVLEAARGASLLSASPAEMPPLTVVAVERYLAEAPPCPPAPPCPAAVPPQYWYDVTLADGSRQERCHLAPSLNGLVQRGHLRPGARLRLTRCSYLYDERRLRYGFPCLEGVEWVAGEPPARPVPVASAPRPPPLRGERKHYLPLWNNEDPYGDAWEAEKPPEKVDVDGKWAPGGMGWWVRCSSAGGLFLRGCPSSASCSGGGCAADGQRSVSSCTRPSPYSPCKYQ